MRVRKPKIFLPNPSHRHRGHNLIYSTQCCSFLFVFFFFFFSSPLHPDLCLFGSPLLSHGHAAPPLLAQFLNQPPPPNQAPPDTCMSFVVAACFLVDAGACCCSAVAYTYDCSDWPPSSIVPFDSYPTTAAFSHSHQRITLPLPYS